MPPHRHGFSSFNVHGVRLKTLTTSRGDELKSMKISGKPVLIFALALALAGCSSTSNPLVEKSTLKACQLQAELFALGQDTSQTGMETYTKLHEMSVEIANTAEDDVAISFWYQSDFLKALADPNTSSDWQPSQEMANASGEIAKICENQGITFQ